MTLEEFNLKYRYKTDKSKFGFIEVWEIPKLQDDGFYYGDCESYCRYLKNNISEFKDWNYYYCKLNGNGHCVLIKDKDIIDCNSRSIMSITEYSLRYNILDLKKYNWFVVGSKIMFAKVYTWIF